MTSLLGCHPLGCHPQRGSASVRPCRTPPATRLRNLTLLLTLFALLPLPAHAHIGSKDVFEQVATGPYKFFVTIRPPTVVPGVATVEVRVDGPRLDSLTLAPAPLTGEASHHPPTPDPMHRSPDDPNFFTGSLWLMATGSWQVLLQANGPAGPATASVPVPAMALSVATMQRSLGILLAILGLILALGMAAIIYGAVREARLAPGQQPSATRRRRAALAGLATLVFAALALFAGDKWWNVEAAGYSANVFRPLALHPTLAGDTLTLTLDPFVPANDERPEHRRRNDDLLPDHGHLMHLYAIRWPQMDAVYHLHPTPTGPGTLRDVLPSMPPGNYRLFADIVHRNGFPETLTATLNLPPDASHNFLDPEDASAYPAPLSAGDLGPSYRLPDGYTMVWDRPANLTANTAELFRFRLLDPHGAPATDMQPYLGMAGHAAFVKTDGSTFAHTHPEGSASMQAMMLANPAEMAAPADHPLSNTVDFPYGFPTPGRYRLFIQMKHNNTVETGVFDAEVH